MNYSEIQPELRAIKSAVENKTHGFIALILLLLLMKACSIDSNLDAIRCNTTPPTVQK